MVVKTLLVDIGGVVLLSNPRFWHLLQDEYGAPANVESIFYGPESPWAACRTEQCTEREYIRIISQRLHMDPATLETIRDVLEWEVNSPMVTWLQTMRMTNGLELIAVSNADRTLEKRLDHYRLGDLFQEIVNSSRVGVAKPEPAIYQKALQRTASLPHQCVFIDDRPANLLPAQECGVLTLLYDDFSQFSQGFAALALEEKSEA